jgi:hypothetical protein
MWKKIREFFEGAWKWVQAVWDRHDEVLIEMVTAVLPMVIEMAFRNDLSGEEKKDAIIKAILDNADTAADTISTSMLNEAIEVAANRYNINIGKLTVEQMEASREAALKAARDFAERKLKIAAEAEAKAEVEGGATLNNDDVE